MPARPKKHRDIGCEYHCRKKVQNTVNKRSVCTYLHTVSTKGPQIVAIEWLMAAPDTAISDCQQIS